MTKKPDGVHSVTKAEQAGRKVKLRTLEKRFDLIRELHSGKRPRSRMPMSGAGWPVSQQQTAMCCPVTTLGWSDIVFPRSVRALDAQSEATRILRAVALLIATLFVVTLSFSWARGIHDTLKNWRAEMLVSEAEVRFENEDFSSGFVRLNKAYGLSPQNEKVIRSLALRCGESGAPQSLYFFDRLEKMGRTTPNDLIAKLSALIMARQFKDAQALAVALLNSGERDEKLIELGCTLENAGFRLPPVLNKTVTELIKSPRDPVKAFPLAQLWMKSDPPDQRDLATKFFWDLAESGKGNIARKAACVLYDHLNLPDPRAAYLAWLMTEQPDADAAQRLRALSLMIRTHPENTERWLRGVVADWSGASLEDRKLLGTLIFSFARPQLLVGLFTLDDALGDPGVAELYVASLTGHNRFEECEKLLKDQRLLVSRAQRAYAEAVLAARTGSDAESCRQSLTHALVAAGAEANPNMLVGVAELAMELRIPSVAEQAYDECRSLRGAEAVAIDGLITLYERTGNTNKLEATTRQALALWPGNERYLEKNVYACLLLGQSMESAFDIAVKLQAARPLDEMRAFLLSMAHARMGDVVISRSELRKLSARGNIPARYRAVIGGLLKGAGDSESASRLVFGITDQDVPLPEEKAFLELARL